MFGSTTTFGQNSSNPLCSQSGFGQTSSNNKILFAPNTFGSPNLFGTRTGGPMFGASSEPAFGAPTSPTFGTSSSVGGKTAFGQSSSNPFCLQSGFGQTSSNNTIGFAPNTFGSPNPFGTQTGGSMFVASSEPAFGAPTPPAFSTSSSVDDFSQSSSNPFRLQSGFGQTSSNNTIGFAPSTFGSPNPFGTQTGGSMFVASSEPGFGAPTTSAFSTSSSVGGSQTTTTTFGTPAFGVSTPNCQPGGSRIATYAQTSTTDHVVRPPNLRSGMLVSIMAMNAYKDKSHEVLRWEDHQLGSRGSQMTTSTFRSPGFRLSAYAGQQGGSRIETCTTKSATDIMVRLPTPPSEMLMSISTTDVYKDKCHEELKWEYYQRGDKGGTNNAGPPSTGTILPCPTTTQENPFVSRVSNLFPSTNHNLFSPKTPTIDSSSLGPNNAGPPTTEIIFPLHPLPTTTQANPFVSTGSNLFPSSYQNSLGKKTPTIDSFPPPTSPFSTMFSPSSSSHPSSTSTTPASTPPFVSSQYKPYLSTAIPVTAHVQTSTPNVQTQPATSSGIDTSDIFNRGSILQLNPFGILPAVPPRNPFGTLPAVPSATPSTHYGISSMHVAEELNPVRSSFLLAPRHQSLRRSRVSARKYHPTSDGQRVPFFVDDEALEKPKAGVIFIPRQNPRALFIWPTEWSSRNSGRKHFTSQETNPSEKNGSPSVDVQNDTRELKDASQRPNESDVGDTQKEKDSFLHIAEMEELMPKLPGSGYYTEPGIDELAIKERAEPGFCSRVKDFVIGRHGFGHIKVYGETDVRGLDLGSIVRFEDREVHLYEDVRKKPPVGQGLNKAFEVTLLNVKCVNKRTMRRYIEGPNVDKYEAKLMEITRERGAEFVSYDPIKGEWKFRVKDLGDY